MEVNILSQYIGLVITLFLLSMICERWSDFLKNFLSESNANDGLGFFLRRWLRIGNLIKKDPPGSMGEIRRQYRILKLNLYCGFFTAWALHADFFTILQNSSKPLQAIGWNNIIWVWQDGFHFDLLPDLLKGLLFLVGCFATGFFISFGSKFWHDMLDLLYQTKNLRRALTDPETYKMDNVAAVEKAALTYPSTYINAAYLEAKQKFMVNPNVHAVALKADSLGYFMEVSVEEPESSIGTSYTYFISPGVAQSIRITIIVLGSDVIKAQTANLASKIFFKDRPDRYGTLGCIVRPKNNTKKQFILTCCHNVLDPAQELPYKKENKREVCGDSAQTLLGRVYSATRDEEIDAALIEVDVDVLKSINNEIPNNGAPVGVRSVYNDDINKIDVFLVGAKSGFKRGKLVGVYCDAKISYSTDKHKLINLIAISNGGETMSQGGDSGSIACDRQLNIIGLVVAGNSTHTYLMPIDTILQKLEMEIHT